MVSQKDSEISSGKASSLEKTGDTSIRSQKSSPSISREVLETLRRESQSFAYLREVRGEPMPPDRFYLALCHNYDQLEDWKRRYGVQEKIRYVASMRDVRGAHDYILLLFGGWQETGDEKVRTGMYLMQSQEAKETVIIDRMEPIVNKFGQVIAWKRREE